MNQALTATSGRLVLIMNPDCRLMPGAFDALAAGLERSADCAIVGPKILDPGGAPQGSARGDPDMLTGLFGRTALLRRVFPWLRVSRRNVVDDAADEGSASIVVDWLSGACMLARRTALASVGGFDERYFLYWEDADLCRRLRACGYHVKYVPAAAAVHEVGLSSRGLKARAIRAFHESAYLYYETHVAPHSGLKRRLARLLLSVRCRLQLLLHGRDPHSRSEGAA
jgi:GT2 family glycosyltransferase